MMMMIVMAVITFVEHLVYTRHCYKYLLYINSLNVHYEVSTITIPILQMKKLRHRDIR